MEMAPVIERGRERKVIRYNHSHEEATVDRSLGNDLVEEILHRLPVKSLKQFECASKTWKSIIFSPTFIAKHLLYQKQNKVKVKVNFLHRYKHIPDCKNNIHDHVSVCNYHYGRKIYEHVDTYSCPSAHSRGGVSLLSKSHDHDHNGSITTTVVSHFPNKFHVNKVSIMGSYNGLVCIRFCKKYYRERYFGIWNPATRKFKVLPSPRFKSSDSIQLDEGSPPIPCNTIVGFSYIPSTSSYKLVQISVLKTTKEVRVEVLNMGADSWGEVVCEGQAETFHELDHCLIGKSYWSSDWFDKMEGNYVNNRPIVANGCLYWLGILRNKETTVLLSFDFEKEVFSRKTVPFLDGHLNYISSTNILAVFEDNPAMFVSLSKSSGVYFQVWTCEGMSKSWTKRFTVGPFQYGDYPIGFWEDQDIIIRHNHAYLCGSSAYLYNPVTKEKKNFPCSELDCNLVFYPYVESLIQV